jgi:hypothetical protein
MLGNGSTAAAVRSVAERVESVYAPPCIGDRACELILRAFKNCDDVVRDQALVEIGLLGQGGAQGLQLAARRKAGRPPQDAGLPVGEPGDPHR